MKTFRHVLLLPAILAAGTACAQASRDPAAYPTRPIRMIVPFTGGSTLDIMARQVADNVGGLLKQNIVVDNRAGANGIIDAELVAKSSPAGTDRRRTLAGITRFADVQGTRL